MASPRARLRPCVRASGGAAGLWMLLAAPGCGDPERSDRADPIRTDSAGVEVVVHAAPPSDAAAIHRVEFLVVLGDGTPGGPLEFGEIGDVDVLADGSIAVLDRMAAHVRSVSPDGTLRRTFGGPGQGPGELSGGLSFAVLPLPTGGLAVPDLDRGAVVAFDADGAVRPAHAWDTEALRASEWRPGDDGYVMVRAALDAGEVLLRRDLDGDTHDTLAVLAPIGGGWSPEDPRWPLLQDGWVWDVDASGRTFTARMSRAEIFVHEAGALVRRISWGSPSRPIRPAQVDTLLGIVARNEGVDSGIPAELREAMRPPEHTHALADLRAGPGGLILVQRPRPVSEMDRRILSVFRPEGFGEARWDVFAASGEYLGVLDFGANVELRRVRGDTLIGIREGDYGVMEPFLARLPPELRAPR